MALPLIRYNQKIFILQRNDDQRDIQEYAVYLSLNFLSSNNANQLFNDLADNIERVSESIYDDYSPQRATKLNQCKIRIEHLLASGDLLSPQDAHLNQAFDRFLEALRSIDQPDFHVELNRVREQREITLREQRFPLGQFFPQV